jgi:uncharacterized protein (DUF488 family)
MQRLMTVGYEKATLSDFIAALKGEGVTTLLDVRELPISRRKGFSKTALREALAAAGIAYRHERDLGSPKAIRHQLHADGDYTNYFAAFTKYIRSQEALLRQLAADLTGGVALMCFERDPATCHRSVVAKRLELLTGLSTRHLEVSNGESATRARVDSRQGVSAA